MTVTNQGYLDPATSIKVGNILAAAGGGWQEQPAWQDPATYFRNGLGFGSPAILDQTAAMWQNLENNQAQSSANEIINANNDVPSWTGTASQNYHQYLGEIYSIITGRNMQGASANADPEANMEKSMQLMADGLHAARDAAYSQWWAVVGIIGGLALSETIVGGLAGAALAIYKIFDASGKDNTAGDDFDKARKKPLYVGDGPNFSWPEPGGTDPYTHEKSFGSVTQP